MTTEFKCTEIYRNGSRAYHYFKLDKTATDDEIKAKAVEIVKKSFETQCELQFSFQTPSPSRPTILIIEHPEKRTNKRLRKMATKWR